jgi:hypothetical protein
VTFATAFYSFGQTSTPTPASPEPTNDVKDPAVVTNVDKKAGDDDQNKPKKEKRGSLILAPIPINSPTFGAGMIFVAGYVFQWKQDDKLSPPPSVGADFRASEGS